MPAVERLGLVAARVPGELDSALIFERFDDRAPVGDVGATGVHAAREVNHRLWHSPSEAAAADIASAALLFARLFALLGRQELEFGEGDDLSIGSHRECLSEPFGSP